MITNTKYTGPPGYPRGGLLADDMGLGKTLTLLAAVAADPSSMKTLIVLSVVFKFCEFNSGRLGLEARRTRK